MTKVCYAEPSAKALTIVLKRADNLKKNIWTEQHCDIKAEILPKPRLW